MFADTKHDSRDHKEPNDEHTSKCPKYLKMERFIDRCVVWLLLVNKSYFFMDSLGLVSILFGISGTDSPTDHRTNSIQAVERSIDTFGFRFDLSIKFRPKQK